MAILEADAEYVEWLLGPEAAVLIAEVARNKHDGLAIVNALRKSLSANRARLVVEQAELRHKAREKFSSVERMFFTPLGLQQATDEVIARHKARQFGSGQNVVDLCCGIGGDLAGLADRGPAVGVEQNPIVARLAAANARVSVRTGNAESNDVGEFDAWHIDPDRRPEGVRVRTTHVELYEPGPQTIERFLRASPNGAIKLAPASDVPPTWADAAEREWITSRRECRQQVAWFGNLTTMPGLRRATVLGADSAVATLAGNAGVALGTAGYVGRFLFVPDSAVIAADLVGELARQFEIASIDGRTVWLTSDRIASTALVSAFEVIEALPFDRRRLRAWTCAHHVRRLEIKTRSVRVSIEQLRRELASPGDEEATLLITPLFGQTTAIIARRFSSAPVPVVT